MEKIWHDRITEDKRSDKSTKIKGTNYKQNVTAAVNKMFLYSGYAGKRKNTFVVITITSIAKCDINNDYNLFCGYSKV